MQDMMAEVTKNRYRYNVESIHAGTLEQIQDQVGDAVRIVPFLAVEGDQPLVAVPTPGTVEIITEKTRSNARMQALGRFTIEYDGKLDCIYLQSVEGKRLLPVWPMGYWATRRPLQVHDFDGRIVVRGGEIVEFVGGEVGIQHVHVENYCGADKAWIGAPLATKAAGEQAQ
jgi:hypothetical protein